MMQKDHLAHSLPKLNICKLLLQITKLQLYMESEEPS